MRVDTTNLKPFDKLDIRPRIVAEVDDMTMIRLLAREEVGLAVVPPIVVTDELNSGLLVEVERFPRLTETFYAVTLARRFPNPMLKELFEAGDCPPPFGAFAPDQSCPF